MKYNFKHSGAILPEKGRNCMMCDAPGVLYACTDDRTALIWLLCKECRDVMKKGSVEW